MTARGARGLKKKKTETRTKRRFPGQAARRPARRPSPAHASRPEASRAKPRGDARCRGLRAAADAESHSRASVSPADQHRLGRTPMPAAGASVTQGGALRETRSEGRWRARPAADSAGTPRQEGRLPRNRSSLAHARVLALVSARRALRRRQPHAGPTGRSFSRTRG